MIKPNKINEIVNEIKPIKNGAYKAVIFLFSSIYTEETKTKFTLNKRLLNRVKDDSNDWLWCVFVFNVCFFLCYLRNLFVFVGKNIDPR